MQTKGERAEDRVRDERKRGERKAEECLLIPIGLSVLRSPFLSAVDFAVKCWKKTFEKRFLLGNITSKQILMPSLPFRKLRTPKGQLVYFTFAASIFSDIYYVDVFDALSRSRR